jgi:hypothetical protein
MLAMCPHRNRAFVPSMERHYLIRSRGSSVQVCKHWDGYIHRPIDFEPPAEPQSENALRLFLPLDQDSTPIHLLLFAL